MSAKVTTAKAPVTTISKYRALVWFLATQELGYAHVQLDTAVDQYTKGDKVVTLQWGSGKLLAFHTDGELVEGKGSMLQRAQNALGKTIPLSGPGSKWNLSAKAKADMDALAAKTFKVVKTA